MFPSIRLPLWRHPISLIFTALHKHGKRTFLTTHASLQTVPYEGIQTTHCVANCQFQQTTLPLPMLRLLDYDGKIVNSEITFSVSPDQSIQLLKTMLQVQVCDQILYDIQRQGRISFYMTSTGEEAACVGTSAALKSEDVLFVQYRELGALMYRGFSLNQILHQCFGTVKDPGQGRQMPIHYCDRDRNIQAISSPLATQIPQAVGAGYSMKMKKQPTCAVVYFGEGAASEGDFAVALNFAATLQSQTIFICRNNGYAISTPVSEQYQGDGIGSRAIAYGIHTIRVDGNDIMAVYEATKAARKLCVESKQPVFIELMTYRVGHHSTSDDSSQYRQDNTRLWTQTGLSPILRFQKYLIHQGIWSEEQHQDFLKTTRDDILKAIRLIEKEKLPSINLGLFKDVYSEMPWNLKEQSGDLSDFLSLNASHYDLNRYQTSHSTPS